MFLSLLIFACNFSQNCFFFEYFPFFGINYIGFRENEKKNIDIQNKNEDFMIFDKRPLFIVIFKAAFLQGKIFFLF
jgi:hypothetical protein